MLIRITVNVYKILIEIILFLFLIILSIGGWLLFSVDTSTINSAIGIINVNPLLVIEGIALILIFFILTAGSIVLISDIHTLVKSIESKISKN